MERNLIGEGTNSNGTRLYHRRMVQDRREGRGKDRREGRGKTGGGKGVWGGAMYRRITYITLQGVKSNSFDSLMLNSN